MKQQNFKKTRLATSLSIILGVSAITPVFAAEEETEEAKSNIEVIEVTGIRSSMIQSMDVKRSSSGIVDAISAEDIGKFPDSNLAESLQRITGISIERSNGEGSKVTARGFGPERNLVTLNGRQLPTTTGERSFDFANLAAEGVSGVQVYKTSKADVPTGGIGATINISTHRPLDNPGQKAVISAEALNDQSTKEGSTTPQFSGLYSNTFDDGKFGVSISGSYSERESGSQQGKTAFWRSFEGVQDNDWGGSNAVWGGVPKDDTQTNRPGDDDIYSVPQNTIYKFEEQQRKRSNAQLVLQYQPTDSITATLDYTYVKKETDTQFNDISVWYNFGPSENIWTDGPISSPAVYSETFDPNNPTDLAMGGGDYSVQDEIKSLGLNLEWQVNDSLSLRLDHHESSATSDPNSPLGSSNLIGMAAFVRTASATDYTGDIPMLSVTGGNAVQGSDMIVTGSSFVNIKNKADISQTQLHGNYVFEEAGSIDFGLSLTNSDNRHREKNVQRNNWGGEGTAGSFDESLFPRKSIHGQFDNLSGGNFEGYNGDVEILENYFAFDFNGIRERAIETLSVQDAALGDCGNSFCPSSDYASQTDQYTEEKMTSVYFQYNYEGEIGDMPFDVHLGVRYEETDVTSTSSVPAFTNEPRWEGTSEVSLISAGSVDYGTQDASYSHTLPSINFNLEVTDDVILRAAYSQTIGRPSYDKMIGGTNLNQGARVSGGIGSTGNAGLLPLESENYDLSAEWYYDEGSYVSLGYFTKDVTNDLLTNTVNGTNTIVNPADGPYAEAARAAVGNDGLAQRQYIFDTYGATDPEHVFMEGGNIIILGNEETDNLMNFGISTPQNLSDSTGYDGIEFAVQHLFGDSGFGGIVNYTKTNTDNSHDDFNLSAQSAELGISDSANVVAFYDKHGFSVRIAYNWRDKFLVALNQDVDPNPRYIEEYAQVDMTASYDIPQAEGLTIFFNAINITEENARTSGRDERQVLDSIQQGARYSLGARYIF